MLIIEGSDFVGKTTFANKLVVMAIEDAKYPVWYCHMSRPNPAFNWFEDYQDYLSKYAVQDRYHLGSLAYHDGVMDLATLRIIEGWLFSLGSFVVLFYCSDYDWYHERLTEHEQTVTNFDVDTLMEANHRFHSMGSFDTPVRPIVDYYIDIAPKYGYPETCHAEAILDGWYKRLRMIPRC